MPRRSTHSSPTSTTLSTGPDLMTASRGGPRLTGEVCNRVNYLNHGSPRIAALGADPRLLGIGALGGADLRDAQDRLDGNSVVIKVPGSHGGLADLPWHRDCGMGGHPVKCPMLNVGIQLHSATADAGQLQMIPGTAPWNLPLAQRTRGRRSRRGAQHRAGRRHGALRPHPARSAAPERPGRPGQAGALPLLRTPTHLRDGRPRAGVQRRALHQERGALLQHVDQFG